MTGFNREGIGKQNNGSRLSDHVLRMSCLLDTVSQNVKTAEIRRSHEVKIVTLSVKETRITDIFDFQEKEGLCNS